MCGVYNPSLSFHLWAWGEGTGGEGDVSLESCLSYGASMVQHKRRSDLPVCHLLVGNPWYKATYFWNWNILMNSVSILPSISCQVLSYISEIPKLGYAYPWVMPPESGDTWSLRISRKIPHVYPLTSDKSLEWCLRRWVHSCLISQSDRVSTWKYEYI